MTTAKNRTSRPAGDIAAEVEDAALPRLQQASQVLEHLLDNFTMSRPAVSNLVQASRAAREALGFTEAAIAALEAEG
jgi:hypothetical protein